MGIPSRIFQVKAVNDIYIQEDVHTYEKIRFHFIQNQETANANNAGDPSQDCSVIVTLEVQYSTYCTVRIIPLSDATR